MSSGNQNLDIKVIDLVFPAVGLVVTAGRTALTIRSGRFWWDDALAIASAIFTTLMSAVKWVYYTPNFGRDTRIGVYYTMAVAFYVALWTARLSILYSIIRIVPLPNTRRLLNRASIAFTCVCLILCAQVFWVCETQPDWKDKPTPQCALGQQVAVSQLLTDIAADFLLITVPVRLFGSVNLERGLKIRLLVIFGAAALTTVASLVHAIYLLEGLGIQSIMSAIVEISVSLIVCNLIVVVPAFWRVCGVRDESRRAQGRAFSFSLSTIRLTSRPDRQHASGVETSVGVSAQNPGVIDVTSILHDPMSSPVADPGGRKNLRLEHHQNLGTESPSKGVRELGDESEGSAGDLNPV